jgi:hypothetical protein
LLGSWCLAGVLWLAAKPRTQRLQTVFFRSWSLPAAPGHRFPRAVWLQGARPFANLAPGGVFEQPLQKHRVLAIGMHRSTANHEVSATRGTPKCIKKVATLRVFAGFARTSGKVFGPGWGSWCLAGVLVSCWGLVACWGLGVLLGPLCFVGVLVWAGSCNNSVAYNICYGFQSVVIGVWAV